MALLDEVERILLAAGEARPDGQIGGFVIEDRDGAVAVWWRSPLTVNLDALRRYVLGRYARTLRAAGFIVVEHQDAEPYLLCTQSTI